MTTDNPLSLHLPDSDGATFLAGLNARLALLAGLPRAPDATRPGCVVPGMEWIHEVAPSEWRRYVYDGEHDVLRSTINPVAGTETPNLPYATPTEPGAVRLSTRDESIAGVANDAAVTPATLAAAISAQRIPPASETTAGLARFATAEEAAEGLVSGAALTPARLGDWWAQQGPAGLRYPGWQRLPSGLLMQWGPTPLLPGLTRPNGVYFSMRFAQQVCCVLGTAATLDASGRYSVWVAVAASLSHIEWREVTVRGESRGSTAGVASGYLVIGY